MDLMAFETYRLSFWEECTGVLHALHVKDGQLIAIIGKISLFLPLEMEGKLQSHIGKRMSVLHTDLPDKPYLFRVISDKEIDGRTDDK